VVVEAKTNVKSEPRGDQEVKIACSTIVLKLTAKGLHRFREVVGALYEMYFLIMLVLRKRDLHRTSPEVPTRSNNVSLRTFQRPS